MEVVGRFGGMRSIDLEGERMWFVCMLKWLRRNKHVGKAGDEDNQSWLGGGEDSKDTDITGITHLSYLIWQAPDT